MRLRHCVRTVEKEDGNLLVGLLTDIDTAVDALGRLIPINLPRRDRDVLALTPIAVFEARASPCSTTVTR